MQTGLTTLVNPGTSIKEQGTPWPVRANLRHRADTLRLIAEAAGRGDEAAVLVLSERLASAKHASETLLFDTTAA